MPLSLESNREITPSSLFSKLFTLLHNFATRDNLPMSRRLYLIKPLLINDQFFDQIVIDPHVDKHADHLNDELIIEIVRQLDNGEYGFSDRNGDFYYFVTFILYQENHYKLIWLHEGSLSYIGVVSLFRDRRIKWDYPLGNK